MLELSGVLVFAVNIVLTFLLGRSAFAIKSGGEHISGLTESTNDMTIGALERDLVDRGPFSINGMGPCIASSKP